MHRLAEAGIEAEVFDNHTAGAYGGLLGAVMSRVMVGESDLFMARRILDEAPK